jgi:hypothetical protein
LFFLWFSPLRRHDLPYRRLEAFPGSAPRHFCAGENESKTASGDRMPTMQQFFRRNTYRHWTAKGRFKIEPEILAESLFFQLWFNDKKLGTYMYPQTAAEELHDGKHDDVLGFSAKETDVPSSLDDWNGLE